MILGDVYNLLTAAELSQLAIGSGGVIKPADIDRINVLIKAGIDDLTRRFMIRTKYISLLTRKDLNLYELTQANSVTSDPINGFIDDSNTAPYTGDIMQILDITNNNGQSLWLNTDVPYRIPVENVFGVRPTLFGFTGVDTPAYNTLRFFDGHDLGKLTVGYKSKAPKIDATVSPDLHELDLPDHYMNALVYYVASRIYNPMGSETIGRGMFHEGNNYMSKYLEEVASLRNDLASIAFMSGESSFIRNGWA